MIGWIRQVTSEFADYLEREWAWTRVLGQGLWSIHLELPDGQKAKVPAAVFLSVVKSIPLAKRLCLYRVIADKYLGTAYQNALIARLGPDHWFVNCERLNPESLASRDNLMATVLTQLEELEQAGYESDPVVTLEDFFTANPVEDSIAPNQVGYGRPPLQEMFELLKKLRERPEIENVLIGIFEYDPLDPDQWLSANHIHILSAARPEQIEDWTQQLCASGVGHLSDMGARQHPMFQSNKQHVKVHTLVWD